MVLGMTHAEWNQAKPKKHTPKWNLFGHLSNKSK
jgi:hypothetical protein